MIPSGFQLAPPRRPARPGRIQQPIEAGTGPGGRPPPERHGRTSSSPVGGASGAPLVAVTALPGRSLGYIDFLVPGILGLTLMQLGLFSVSFGFVQLKRTGGPASPVRDAHQSGIFPGCAGDQPPDHRPDAGAGPARSGALVRAAPGGQHRPAAGDLAARLDHLPGDRLQHRRLGEGTRIRRLPSRTWSACR